MRIFGRAEEEPPPQSRVGQHRVSTAAGTPAPGSPGSREPGRGPREGPVLAIFALLTVVAAAGFLWREEADAVDDPVVKAARGEVKGVSEHSFLVRENLVMALEKVARSHTPLVMTLRIAADRVTVVARDASGRRSVLTVDPALKLTSIPFGEGEDEAFAVSEIDSHAPARIMRGLRSRAGTKPEDVDYFFVSASGIEGDNAWAVFLKSGPPGLRHWVAARDGSDLRRLGELSRRARRQQARDRRRAERERQASIRRAERQQRAQRRRIERTQACLRRATSREAVARCFER